MPVDLTELVNKKKQESASVNSESGGVDLTELIARKKAETTNEEAKFQDWWNTNPDVVAWKDEFKKEYGEEPKQGGD